jgi:hypothetical protein
LGKQEGGSFYWDFNRWRTDLENEHLSAWERCGGNLEGQLLHWRPWRICEGRLWTQASLFIGAGLGNQGLWQPVK